jgi:cbb3-type cytochrome oxidase maturation protein
MDALLFLVPLALLLASLGLGAFFWSLRTGQYDDLQGAAERILLDDDDDSAEAIRRRGPN